MHRCGPGNGPRQTRHPSQTGADAGLIARKLDMALSTILELGMLAFASLASPSLTMLLRGLKGDVVADAVAPAVAAIEATEALRIKASAARDAPVKQFAAPAPTPDRLARYFRETVRIENDGEVLAGQLYDAFMAWWMVHYPKHPVPNLTAFGLAAKQTGLIKERRGGRTRYLGVLLEMVH